MPRLNLPPGVKQELVQAQLHRGFLKVDAADGRDGHAAVPAKDTFTPPTGLNQAPLACVPSLQLQEAKSRRSRTAPTVPAKDTVTPPTPAKPKSKPKTHAAMSCQLCSRVYTAGSDFRTLHRHIARVHTHGEGCGVHRAEGATSRLIVAADVHGEGSGVPGF